jgi:hypothetical protein
MVRFLTILVSLSALLLGATLVASRFTITITVRPIDPSQAPTTTVPVQAEGSNFTPAKAPSAKAPSKKAKG